MDISKTNQQASSESETPQEIASQIKVTILGTGTSQGVPVIACNCKICKSQFSRDKRLRSSILIETLNNVFAVDAGPDFRHQMLREDVCRLDAILVTHDHKDHIGGLDDIRAFNWIMKKPMQIFASESTMETIKKDFSYAFEKITYPGVPQLILNVINDQPFIFNKDKIVPIMAMHGNLPVLGFRIGSFTYITDANFISEEEMQKIKGSKVLIINGLRKTRHYSHFNLDEAIEIIRNIAPEKGYITHISHAMGFHSDVNKQLPEGIELAYDGLKFSIDY
jgi:phosphoribosyl 1,2-cyclic phosphate phosphodiesterase